MSEDGRDPARRVVDGRFELETRLGGGGMGTVWRARDLVLHRLVAVKEVRPPDRDLAEYDPEGARMLRERVLREARALARLDHPNVVTIHHVVDGGEGTYPWLVMELVTGGSLADRLERGPMTPPEAARIGRGVLAALRAAHDAGIEHRDVKPANVLIRPDGRPVLTDFGIAAIRGTTTLTTTGSLIGTADFMAPERVSGHEGGAASDLWSLAMMLYTAVEGHHPLRRGTTVATLAAVLHEDVPPPVRAGALGDVLMGVLVRDPAARPTADALDRALAAVESGRTGPAPTTSYSLAPPSGPPTAPVAHGSFGPPPFLPHPGQTMTVAQRPATGSARGRAVLYGVTGASLTGALALLWWLLPLGTDDHKTDSDGRPTTSATGPAASSGARTPAASSGARTPAADRSKAADTVPAGGLLTPDGIRTAIKAFEEATGRDRYADFTVYPDHASAELMVEGSDKKYDSYTYWPGRGVEKGIISGTVIGGDRPVRLDGFDWTKVPALFDQAEKKLNVDKPTLRYVTLKSPSTTFDTPAGMAVYLADDYGTGYLVADPHGKVTSVYPAED
ncbi:serine/threonine-protein kinase [Streptomyces sp. NPDC059374]|uniref:serine/threonine-protein kinase n=1 Tax=Streptomyces sp. NPDC059374 TaxID=3346814 RepID=UPI0036A60D51